MTLRVKFTKEGYLKYISHLDMMRLFDRAFRRGNIPIRYSQGFNPQPKLSIANPLALGIESQEEFMDIELSERIPETDFIDIMNKELPEGIRIIDVKYVDDKRIVSSIVGWSYYEIKVKVNNMEDLDSLQYSIDRWLRNTEILLERTRYKKGKEIKDIKNIRPLIGNVTIDRNDENLKKDNGYVLRLYCLLKSNDSGNLKPTDFLKAFKEYTGFDMDIEMADIKRLNMYTDVDGSIQSPM